MAVKLNPYVSFPGTAREAMRFYEQVLGGTLTLTTFGDAGMEGVPEPDQVMHAQLEAPGDLTLMGADVPPGTEHRPGNDVAISLSGDDDALLRGYWEQLSEGGTVIVPLDKQMWGDVFGMCTDPYGVTWMVDITAPQD